MKRIAFAGFRHGHIYALYNQCLAASDIVEIAGAWEEDEAARAAAEKDHGVVFDGRSFDDLLADPTVDIIAVGDYYGRRGELCIRALEAGKHVIADKPICTDLGELELIESLAEKKGLKVGCMLSLRYSRYTAPAKEIISSGRLGEVTAVSFNGQHGLDYGSRPMWYFKKGKHGGVINDLAIHGVMRQQDSTDSGSALPVAPRSDVTEGDATVICTVSGEVPESYSAKIIAVDRAGNDTKNFVIEVTDPRLLEITGGIVQGMSGSPVIQNGKLAGALTHVLVNDPTKGYGIFIENMIAAMRDF